LKRILADRGRRPITQKITPQIAKQWAPMVDTNIKYITGERAKFMAKSKNVGSAARQKRIDEYNEQIRDLKTFLTKLRHKINIGIH